LQQLMAMQAMRGQLPVGMMPQQQQQGWLWKRKIHQKKQLRKHSKCRIWWFNLRCRLKWWQQSAPI